MSILAPFIAHGIHVHADGPELVLRGRLTTEIMAYARKHKPEILATLRRQQSPATANAAARIARTPTGGAEATPAATAQAVERLVLYIGRQSNDKAWSRWPLDERFWAPELN